MGMFMAIFDMPKSCHFWQLAKLPLLATCKKWQLSKLPLLATCEAAKRGNSHAHFGNLVMSPKLEFYSHPLYNCIVKESIVGFSIQIWQK